jgi:hypothetical protein
LAGDGGTLRRKTVADERSEPADEAVREDPVDELDLDRPGPAVDQKIKARHAPIPGPVDEAFDQIDITGRQRIHCTRRGCSSGVDPVAPGQVLKGIERHKSPVFDSP